ncbi:hypothetical protein [Polaribacter sp. R77954]|uniref:hypothetical protein n=1 Tax=Polaribacter sp. R77954 TaxID=3093870 RepID=UPI0037C6E5D8
MHKKLEADLISLAHSILTMKNKDDVFALKEKSKEVYEKLSMLAFVEEYVNTTPNLQTTKEELLKQVVTAFETKENFIAEQEVAAELDYDLSDDAENEVVNQLHQNKIEAPIEQPFDELEELMFSSKEMIEEVKSEKSITEVSELNAAQIEKDTEPKTPIISDVIKVEERKRMSLEEELQDIVSVDVMADFFENAQPKSLNDKLAANIQIGLNDRIAFVKNLFNNQQEDYNRVISQLNTFKSERDAKTFIKTLVKPDYDWSEKEELENRFMEIIARKFA